MKSSKNSNFVNPVEFAGIVCMEGENPCISIKIHDYINQRNVVRDIPVDKFSPKTLKKAIETANGVCIKEKEQYKLIFKAYKRELTGQLTAVAMKHEKLGWSFDDEDNLEFRCKKIISAVSRRFESGYSGNVKLQSPSGNLENLKEIFNQYIINTNEWSPLQAAIAFGAGATVLPFANAMWDTNMNNHVIHTFGDTSTGKTSAMHIFVGMGSNPNPDKGFKFLHNSTINALIRSIGNNKGFPVGIDELSATDSKKKYDEFIYTIGNKAEKIRLGAGGKKIQDPVIFETIVMSNGEVSLHNKCSKNGGLLARMTELANVLWTESKEQAEAINRCMMRNYGLVTPLIAEELLREPSYWKNRWDSWQNRTNKEIQIQKLCFSLTERVSNFVVLFCMSSEIVSKVLDIKLDLEEIFKFCFLHFLVAKASEANLAERACDYVKSFISRNHAKILDYVSWEIIGETVPLGDDDIGFTYITRKPRPVKDVECNRVYAIRRQIFEDILAAGNFPIKVTLHKLQEEKYLMTQGKRNYDKVYTVNGVDAPFIVIFVPDRSNGGIGFGDDEDDLKDVA